MIKEKVKEIKSVLVTTDNDWEIFEADVDNVERIIDNSVIYFPAFNNVTDNHNRKYGNICSVPESHPIVNNRYDVYGKDDKLIATIKNCSVIVKYKEE